MIQVIIGELFTTLQTSECQSSTPRRIWGASLRVAGNDELELVSEHEAEVKSEAGSDRFLMKQPNALRYEKVNPL